MNAELPCQEVVELVTDALDGALAPEEQRAFGEHLATCPHCRTYVAQLQVTVDALHGLAEGEADPPGVDRVRGAFLARRCGPASP